MAKKAKVFVKMESVQTIFPQILDLLEYANFKDLSEESGVHISTLYHWYSGLTIHPRIDTLTKVAQALGYSILLQRKAGRRPSLRVIK